MLASQRKGVSVTTTMWLWLGMLCTVATAELYHFPNINDRNNVNYHDHRALQAVSDTIEIDGGMVEYNITRSDCVATAFKQVCPVSIEVRTVPETDGNGTVTVPSQGLTMEIVVACDLDMQNAGFNFRAGSGCTCQVTATDLVTGDARNCRCAVCPQGFGESPVSIECSDDDDPADPVTIVNECTSLDCAFGCNGACTGGGCNSNTTVAEDCPLCKEDIFDGNNGGGDGGNSDGQGQCFRLNTEAKCLNTTDDITCRWCSEQSVCRANRCPGDTGGGGNSTGGGAQICNPLQNQTDCGALDECQWCTATSDCRASTLSCPRDTGGAGNGACVPFNFNETNCEASGLCQWCGGGDKPGCFSSTMTCPGENNGGGNDRGPSPATCNPMSNETDCLGSDGCFWCSSKSVCRVSFDKCPGNENVGRRPNVCPKISNDTECSASSCFWCGESGGCRKAEAECPGRGRGKACTQSFTEESCSDETDCAWVAELAKCAAARGVVANATVDDDALAPCPLLASAEDCTEQLACRWCPLHNKCLKATEGSCPGGFPGTRGDPCPDRSGGSTSCTATGECLWCPDAETCTRPSNNACDAEVILITSGVLNITEVDSNTTDVCPLQDARPECDDTPGCRWCRNAMRCRKEQTSCGQPTRQADVSLDEEGRSSFKIQDTGLGVVDPNAVTVDLSHLYEVDEEGDTIAASLVDFEVQNFKVKQEVGNFFDGIRARRVSLEAVVETVGSISIETYIMLESGTIASEGNETWSIVEGDVKFNVLLSDWVFCGDEGTFCGDSNQTSAFLDLAIEIKGRAPSPEPNVDNRLLFDLGGNVPLLLSGEIIIDGDLQSMPDGFPRLESTGDQGDFFVFRFPRFIDTAAYDPIVPYHTAELVILEDDAPETAAPTLAPVADPTLAPSASPPSTSAPTADPADVLQKEDDDGLTVLGLVLIIAGGIIFCFCCICCIYIFKRTRGGANEVGDEDGGEKGSNAADEQAPFWGDDNDMMAPIDDPEAQERFDEEGSQGRSSDDNEGEEEGGDSSSSGEGSSGDDEDGSSGEDDDDEGNDGSRSSESGGWKMD